MAPPVTAPPAGATHSSTTTAPHNPVTMAQPRSTTSTPRRTHSTDRAQAGGHFIPDRIINRSAYPEEEAGTTIASTATSKTRLQTRHTSGALRQAVLDDPVGEQRH